MLLHLSAKTSFYSVCYRPTEYSVLGLRGKRIFRRVLIYRIDRLFTRISVNIVSRRRRRRCRPCGDRVHTVACKTFRSFTCFYAVRSSNRVRSYAANGNYTRQRKEKKRRSTSFADFLCRERLFRRT